MPSRKAVLAYSGGLDTSVILRTLQERGFDVVAVIVDVGQREDFDRQARRAETIGASKVYVEDLRREFVTDFIYPAIAGNAVYENRYLLGTALARPLIARCQAEIAIREGADVLSHGATGKGNDQVRFELAYAALAPEIEVYAPWKDAEFLSRFQGRTDLLNYAEAQGIPIEASSEKPYSMDENLMHKSYEAGLLEDPMQTPTEDMFSLTVSPMEAPDRPTEIEIEFRDARPVRVADRTNGVERTDPLALFEYLNELGGSNGIGRIDIVENRFVGIKSRGVYEAPALELLGQCYDYLLQLILDRRARRIFTAVSGFIAEQIYQGYWFDTATQASWKLIEHFNQLATGTISVSLYKGHVAFGAASDVPHSLYSADTASMEAIGDFDHRDSEGFLGVLGVSARALHQAGQIEPPSGDTAA